MCSLCFKPLSSSAISFSNVSDQQLIEVLNNRLSELHVLVTIQIFSSDKPSSTDNVKTSHHDILYIVSSEDEVTLCQSKYGSCST